MKMRGRFRTSHSSLNFLVKELGEILEKTDMSAVKVKDLARTLKTLQSQKRRTTFYRRHFHYVSPSERFVSHRFDRRIRNGATLPKQISNTFQYVSIRETLSKLFSVKEFRDAFFEEKPSTDGYMRSHRDGEDFKSNELLKSHPHAARLQLFFDDLEVANPLGTNTSIHEVVMFCFSRLNMPPVLNSSISNIYALAVCNTGDVKQHNFEFVLRPFIEELKILESEEGMSLDIPDLPGFRVRGILASVTGDTKGIHEIFGLMGPGSKNCCRICLVSR